MLLKCRDRVMKANENQGFSIPLPAVKVITQRHLYTQGEAVNSSRHRFKPLQLDIWQVFHYKPPIIENLGIFSLEVVLEKLVDAEVKIGSKMKCQPKKELPGAVLKNFIEQSTKIALILNLAVFGTSKQLEEKLFIFWFSDTLKKL